MEDSSLIDCACKGKRTCLICEKKKGLFKQPEKVKDELVYNYCHDCNWCWPEADIAYKYPPLYLGYIFLMLEFLTQDEESESIKAIDNIPWVPSQSGRRKQDFGPRVNFKKKKIKLDTFAGFPKFTKPLIKKLLTIDSLSDFQPVELCHLEYCPERGSAIEAHIDDMWLWGERLVTINLGAATTLVLTPSSSNNDCNCKNSISSTFCQKILHLFPPQNSNENKCAHSSILKKNELNDLMACDIKETIEFHNKLTIRIFMPPRSLLLLAGCARHTWFHEIRRQDITSRRLAMTFRELSQEFLPGGKNSKIGEEIFSLADKDI